MKPGDKCEVIIDGVEYELAKDQDLPHFPELRYLKPKPQKSELEKFVESYLLKNYSIDGYNPRVFDETHERVRGDVKVSALALQEFYEQELKKQKHPFGYELVEKGIKWCGK